MVWHMTPKLGCLLLVFSMSAAPVDAHDIYMHLKTPLGFHCCTGQDCRPAHYRSGGDGIEMLVDNRWLPVAGYDVMYRSLPGDTGETFGGHWCGRNIPIEGGYITYCAVLPPNGQPRMCRSETIPPLSLVPRAAGNGTAHRRHSCCCQDRAIRPHVNWACRSSRLPARSRCRSPVGS